MFYKEQRRAVRPPKIFCELLKNRLLLDDKGLLITFEGIDGSGKTTQIRRFITALEGNSIPHILLREPGGRRSEKKSALYCWINPTWNASHHRITALFRQPAPTLPGIDPACFRHRQIVICDRFSIRPTVYQATGGIDLNFIKFKSSRYGNLIPDLTLY
jgi:dTMP kinase